MTMLALQFIGGLLLLLGGGESLVRGAGSIARGMGVPPVVVGLTVVAFGTSAPELVVAVTGSVTGAGGIAFGNVVGSNIFNLLLVLGAASWVLPIESSLHTVRFDLFFVGALTLLCAFSLRRERTVGRLEGGIYLLGYVCFLALLYVQGRSSG